MIAKYSPSDGQPVKLFSILGDFNICIGLSFGIFSLFIRIYVLQLSRCSVKSDAWSFGVFLWEVFTFGCHPYPELDNEQVSYCFQFV